MPSDRIAWAVEVLSPGVCDQIFEVGCGHGVAASLVCDRLIGGRLVAIDRSPAMIDAAQRRNAIHVAAGRAEFRVAALAEAEFGSTRFDRAFALRVGLFARQTPQRELAVLERHLMPSGRLFLFHDEPARRASDVVRRLEAGVSSSGWTIEATRTRRFEDCDVACVIARPPV